VLSGTGAFSFDTLVRMNKGDSLQIELQDYLGNVFSGLRFEITQVPFGIDGSTLDFEVVMPSMKVSDFINGFLRTYNAVLIPVSNTEFELHNIDDYYALGDTKEWTDYIDMTDIKHEKVPIPAKYQWHIKRPKI
jgi:predicted RNA methylase